MDPDQFVEEFNFTQDEFDHAVLLGFVPLIENLHRDRKLRSDYTIKELVLEAQVKARGRLAQKYKREIARNRTEAVSVEAIDLKYKSRSGQLRRRLKDANENITHLRDLLSQVRDLVTDPTEFSDVPDDESDDESDDGSDDTSSNAPIDPFGDISDSSSGSGRDM